MIDINKLTAAKRVVVIGDCIMIEGDCLEVMPQIGKVDAVVTDPPYGIGADKKNAHSSIRDNPAWARRGWDDSRPPVEVFDLIKGMDAAIWGGNYFSDLLPATSGWLAWVKPQAGTGFSLADMELCWTNRPISARTFFGGRRDGNQHPTQKTVEVMLWTLGFFKTAKIILDPFMGSGTTLVACAKTGKSGIGIELDPDYFDIACRRVREAYAQPDFFIANDNKPAKQEAMI